MLQKWISYVFNKGWKFKGPRLDEDMFSIIIKDINNSKNTLTYYADVNMLILTRGRQTAIRISLDGDPDNWCVTYPISTYAPFSYTQVSSIKTLIKIARKG